MATAVYETIKASANLPSPTGVALEILRLAKDENSTLQELARVIETDPALSSRVLQLVNSPFAALPRQVGSIERAVGLLGQRTITGLALAFFLVCDHHDGSCRGFDYKAFWSDSLARAVAAKHVAGLVKGFAPDEVFTCGLLSQIGRLAFATAFPDTYTGAIRDVPEDDCVALAATEYTVFGIDHPRLASEMMRDWHLPVLFRDAVRSQLAPEDAPGKEDKRPVSLAQVLHLSGLIARIMSRKDVAPRILHDLSETARSLDLSESQVNEVIDAVVAEWREIGRIFNVATREVPPAAVIYEQAAALRGSQTVPSSDSPVALNCEEQAREAESFRILVVDRDADVRALLVEYLTRAGYAVMQARDGAEALSLMLTNGLPIVITGLEMPNMDGLDLCRAIRTHPGIAFTYVILATARDASDERIVEALDAGADNVLTKPFRCNELLARLRAAERIAKLQLDLEARRRQGHKYNAEMEIANAKLATFNEHLVRMATTDELTGLVNRREALNRLSQAWASATRSEKPLSVIMMDLDHFKACNDSNGHAVGDAALKGLADVMSNTAREEESVCRIGGEEFLIICPQSAEESAAVGAERIRHAVEQHVIQFDGISVQLTVSLGVAQRSKTMNSPDALLRAADKALYAAKHSGRNTVCLASRVGATPDADSPPTPVANPQTA